MFRTFGLVLIAVSLLVEACCGKPEVDVGGVGVPRRLSGTSKLVSKRNDEMSEEYLDYYYHDLEEPDCPDQEFFHIRGRRCVPYDCPGGNQYRNQYTGECLLKRYGIAQETKERPQKMLNRLTKQNKFRLPFGLTLKG